MITVTIFVNGSPVYSRSARNVTGKSSGPNRYLVDTGDVIQHFREEGAVVLAKKMLDTVHDINGEV